MASWWSKLTTGLFQRPAAPPAPTSASPVPRAAWLPADAPGNPFDVPVLDLMVTQTLLSTSKDPAAATTALSWRTSTGAELDPKPVLEETPRPCELRYPAAASLPDGLLYAPHAMDQKWVLAWRDGRILAARSWTGAVVAAADGRRDGPDLVVTSLRLAESPLAADNATEVFDWLIRSHALGQRLPFPADEATAAMFEAVPHVAFSSFGDVIFCAARSWNPPPPDRPLRSDGRVVQSMRRGRVSEVVAAVEAGDDVDAPGTFAGYTALHVAIVQGNLPAVERLIELGANVNRRADAGMFALGLAVVHGHGPDLLDALDAFGADLHASNDAGFGALHAAAETDRSALVGWLVRRGLDLEARTARGGYTPFHIACALGHLATARALAGAGADVAATSAEGQTALDIARQEGRDAVVAWLEDGAPGTPRR